MKKIELKHLVAYLDHKVECSYKEYKDEKKRLKAFLTGVSITDGIETTYKRKREGCSGDHIGFDGNNNINDLEFKLHLRHLSDLTKEIEVNGEKSFVPLSELSKCYPDNEHVEYLCEFDGDLSYTGIEFSIVQVLLSWHFDIFGLIKENLAIDINTL